MHIKDRNKSVGKQKAEALIEHYLFLIVRQMHHGHFCLSWQCWAESPSWEGSCAKQGTGELSRSPASWCCSQKFTLSFRRCVVLRSARNVKCPPFCNSGTKITVMLVFKDFKSLDHPVFILIYLQCGLWRAGIGYFSRYLKFRRAFINHNVNGIQDKTDMKVEAYGRGKGKVAFFPLLMQKKKKKPLHCCTAAFFLDCSNETLILKKQKHCILCLCWSGGTKLTAA